MPITRSSTAGLRKSLDKSRRSEDNGADTTVKYIWQVGIVFCTSVPVYNNTSASNCSLCSPISECMVQKVDLLVF